MSFLIKPAIFNDLRAQQWSNTNPIELQSTYNTNFSQEHIWQSVFAMNECRNEAHQIGFFRSFYIDRLCVVSLLDFIWKPIRAQQSGVSTENSARNKKIHLPIDNKNCAACVWRLRISLCNSFSRMAFAAIEKVLCCYECVKCFVSLSQSHNANVTLFLWAFSSVLSLFLSFWFLKPSPLSPRGGLRKGREGGGGQLHFF